MSLEHLHLRDVRRIRELELPLANENGRASKWTLLPGENGAGWHERRTTAGRG